MAAVTGVTTDLGQEVLLDLDEFVRAPSFIRYKGQLHEIFEPSVDGYLKILLLKRRYLRDNQGVEDEYIQVQQAAGLVSSSVPSIPMEDLMKMGMAKLMKITEAIEKATNAPDATEEATGTKGEGDDDQSALSMS